MTENKRVNWTFLIMVVVYILTSLALGRFLTVSLSVPASILLSETMIVAPLLIYLKVRHISVLELIPFRKMKFRVCILVIVCTYLMYPLLIVLNALTLFFVESGTADMVSGLQNGSFFVATLFMAILPALAEEFVFRGVLFQTYRRSRMLPAIFISGFLFGCMHLNFNQFLYAFVLGIYLAFLVEATGSILSSMLAHFVLNFTSVMISFLTKPVEEGAAAELQQQMMADNGNFLSNMDTDYMLMLLIGILVWAVIAIGTTAGAVGVYIGISKISGRWEHVKTMFRHKTKERILTIPLALAMVLMAGIMLWSAFL